jgi:hypothetical protein
VLATGAAERGTGASVAGASVGAATVGVATCGVVTTEAVDDSAVLDGVTCAALRAVGSVAPAMVVAVNGGNVDTPTPATVVVVTAGRSEATVAEVVVVCAEAPVATPRMESAESALTMTTDFPMLLGDEARCAERERWNLSACIGCGACGADGVCCACNG